MSTDPSEQGLDPSLDGGDGTPMIEEDDEEAALARAQAEQQQAAAQIELVVLPLACVNEGKGAPLGMGIQRWWAMHLAKGGLKAAAPVFTALTERNGQRIPALLVYRDSWADERILETCAKFENAKTAIVSQVHATEQLATLEVRVVRITPAPAAEGAEAAGPGLALEELTKLERSGSVDDLPRVIDELGRELAERLGATVEHPDWKAAFGTEQPQAALSFLVGLGNLAALQGRVVPATSDQLLTPLIDALQRDPGLDAAMDVMHQMVEILVANQPDRGAVQLSLQALSIAQQRRPKDPEVSLHLALLLRQLGDLQSAVGAFNQAFNLDPTSERIASTFIDTLRAAGDLDNAFKVAEFALERGNDSPLVAALTGSILIAKDRHDEAEPLLRRAIEEGQVSSAYGDLANVLWDRADPATEQGREDRQEAMSLLETAMREGKIAKSTLDMLLDLYEEEGDERALELLLGAAERFPAAPAIQIAVANAYLDGDDPKRAEPFLRRVLEAPRRTLDDDAFARRQLLALGAEDFEDRYQKALEAAERGDAKAKAGAALFFREVIAKDPRYWQPHMLLGQCVRPIEGDLAALAHFNQAVALRPNDLKLRSLLANLLRENGRPREAVDHLRAIVALAPREVQPVVALAATLRDANLFDDARQVCQAALNMLPDHPEFTRILASLPPPSN